MSLRSPPRSVAAGFSVDYRGRAGSARPGRKVPDFFALHRGHRGTDRRQGKEQQKRDGVLGFPGRKTPLRLCDTIGIRNHLQEAQLKDRVAYRY